MQHIVHPEDRSYCVWSPDSLELDSMFPESIRISSRLLFQKLKTQFRQLGRNIIALLSPFGDSQIPFCFLR
jgi:hypothetical protein